MKQKDYLKLVVDTTTLVTKAKLLQDQINVVTAEATKQLATTTEKLKGIDNSLGKIHKEPSANETNADEAAITGITIKKLLATIEKELKANVEHPIIQQDKQITTLREALEKTLSQQEELGQDPEFDCTAIQENIANTQSILNTNNQKLQTIMQQHQEMQLAINKYMQANSALTLEQELQETMQKTTVLARRISNIEHCLEQAPELAIKHAKQVAPLRYAFAALTTQTKLLALTEHVPMPETTEPTSPAKTGKRTTSPARAKIASPNMK